MPSSLDLFGKSVSDLQSDVRVGNSAISGELYKITGYTGFSSKAAEQSGNYLALHADVPGADDATIKVELIGGTSGEVTLDSDRVIVLKIRDNTQKVKITASKAGLATVSKTYALSLTLKS